MGNFRWVFFVLAGLITFESSVPSLAAQSKKRSADQRVDDYLQKLEKAGLFHGSVYVFKGQKTILSKGYGYSDIEAKRRNRADTPFLLASLTKSFIAALTLKRVFEGALSLDSKLSSFTHVRDCYSKVTVADLLRHSSRIPDYIAHRPFPHVVRAYLYPELVLENFVGPQLKKCPPPGRSYSNTNYLALGLILRDLRVSPTYRTSVSDLRQLLQPIGGFRAPDELQRIFKNEVFDPIGLRNTKLVTEYRGNMAQPYELSGSGYKEAPYRPGLSLFGAGDMISSAEDLGLWLQTLFRDQSFLPPELVQEMLQTQYENFTYGASVGAFNGQIGMIRWGGLAGVYNVMSYFPRSQTGIVILTNARSSSKLGSGYPRQLLPKILELISK